MVGYLDDFADLFEHAGSLGNLSGHAVVEERLRQDGEGFVLGLDSELLGLDVDINSVECTNASSGLARRSHDPATELIVGAIATAVAFAIVIAVIEHELLLQVLGKFLCASLDSCLGNINCPFVILDFGR